MKRFFVRRLSSWAGSAGEEFLFLGDKTLLSKLDGVAAHCEQVAARLAARTGHGEEVVKLLREQAALEEAAALVASLRRLDQTLAECAALASEAGQEPEMVRMAEEERARTAVEAARVEASLAEKLLTGSEHDEETGDEVVLEVRAGTGGAEAQLFAEELFGMYRLHCEEARGWKFRPVSNAAGDGGGVREASAIVGGRGAYAELRLEGGVHRVSDLCRVLFFLFFFFFFLFTGATETAD
jgi:peptide chain release factor 1